MSEWRVAKSLLTLREQVNLKWPKRRKDSDGTKGDNAHAARKSDHNPLNGVVHALDITHDPASGCDSYRLLQALLDSRDPRIDYLISNGRIAYGARGAKPWVWQKYIGSNPHNHHGHISVHDDAKLADDEKPWRFDFSGEKVPAPDTEYVAPMPTLKVGMRSDIVKIMQALLNTKKPIRELKVDGIFGSKQTLPAVQHFQRGAGLDPDGKCGPLTWKALQSP